LTTQQNTKPSKHILQNALCLGSPKDCCAAADKTRTEQHEQRNDVYEAGDVPAIGGVETMTSAE
jgi:hypothetical protein